MKPEKNRAPKPERILDPIHRIIKFDETNKIDRVAWMLKETPEFQRLRRIKQLGVSDFVFPGATHTRFIHSIGVFNNARCLLDLIHREIDLDRVPGNFDKEHADVALFAALLHDIGHGPFSHAFEEARKAIVIRRSGDKNSKIKKHEGWTADIVRSQDHHIRHILENFEEGISDKIADLIEADTPSDMYHAIVSSSFDADRLDYILRDRYMSGTGSGAIDLDWLYDNVRVAKIDMSAPEDGEDPVYTHSFCLNYKARGAAEDFVLARHRLYSNVYFHKTTRGIEQLITAILMKLSKAVDKKQLGDVAIDENHPLIKFLMPDGESLDNYLALDDYVLWGVFDGLTRSKNKYLSELSRRIINRENLSCIDIETTFPEDEEMQRRAQKQLNDMFSGQMDTSVFKDITRLTLYGEIGADEQKAHKRLMILLRNGSLREITKFDHSLIQGSERGQQFVRYYFLNESDYEKANDVLKGLGR